MPGTKNKQRAKYLFVEFLEARRLLSASPYRPSLAGFNTTLDAQRSHGNENSAVGHEIRSGTSEAHRQNSAQHLNDPRVTQHESNRRVDSSFGSSNRLASNPSRSRQNQQFVGARSNLTQPNNELAQRVTEIVPTPSRQPAPSLDTAILSSQSLVLNSLEAIVPRSPVTPAASLLPNIALNAPDLTPSPRVPPSAEATEDISEGQLGTTTQSIEATTPNTALHAPAIEVTSEIPLEFAAWLTSQSFDINDDDAVFSKRTVSDYSVLGGEIDLNRTPELIDTLPAITSRDVWPNELSELNRQPKEEEEEEEHRDGHCFDELGKSNEAPDNTAVEKQPSPNASKANMTPVTSAEESCDSVDFVFADSESSGEFEEFGGLVEMPNELPLDCEESGAVSFDSIKVTPHRIDQITVRSSEPNDQDTEESEDEPPIAIDVRASLPALLLFVPSLLAKKPRKTKKMKKPSLRFRGRLSRRKS